MGEVIRVLHVDDDPAFLDLTADVLGPDGFEVTSVERPEAGLEVLASEPVDCVVSDYDMPGTSGLDFLEQVRERYNDLPFVLFTGKGSEEVAADAISRGVSDYLQKGPGLDRYELLANRIEHLTEGARARAEAEGTREWYSRLLANIPGYVFVVDEDASISYCSPSVEQVMGYAPAQVEATEAFEYTHPEDVDDAMAAFSRLLTEPDDPVTVSFRARHADGSMRRLEVQGRNLLSDAVIGGVIVHVRDVTGRAVEG